MHVKRISAPRHAMIDCTWIENALPGSLFDLIVMIIDWFKGPAD